MKKFYVTSALAFLVMVFIVFVFPIGFSEYRNSDVLAPLWYWITTTGSVWGASVVIIILYAYLRICFKNRPGKLNSVYYFTALIFIIEILSAGSTLFLFKNVFKTRRPSQLYFIEKGLIKNGDREYSAMNPEEKSKYLRKKINEQSDGQNYKFDDIYPPILTGWTEDNEYSFPSGHSQNSFFLGTVFAFVIYKTSSKKYYIVIPLVWEVLTAISRVVIGAHYPVDVTGGAFIGLVMGLIVVSLKKINAIFN